MESARVKEVRELSALLEEHHMSRMGALRTAVECVYGMAERYHRHNFAGCVDRERQNDQEWQRVSAGTNTVKELPGESL